MNVLSRIWFPATVLATAAVLSFAHPGREVTRRYIPEDEAFADTVVYLKDAYKLKRIGSFDAVSIADSLLQMADSDSTSDALLDTLPHLTARDTIPVPDSLRLTDPFRYKYYVALIDSLTHVIVRDSLQRSSDSLKISADTLRARRLDSLARIDFEHAISDSLDWRMIDSIYVADSTAVAKEKFLQWYNSLSRKERRKYDMEQALPKKLAEMDSLQKIKEEKQAERDSVTEYTPRILETAFLTDTMQYKRIDRKSVV